MKKQLMLIILITLFTLIIAGSVSAADNETTDITINDTNQTTVILPDPYNTRTGISYTTIQSAIDDPLTQNGDTIEVEPGTYTENVIVNKNLTILATGPNTIVNGSFTITSAGSGSTIQGFTINHFVSSNLFSENFDSVSAPGLPSGWAVVDVSGIIGNWATNVGTVHPSGNAAHSGPNIAYFNSYSAVNGNNARLYRTTGLDLSGINTAILTFWMFHETGYVAQADNIQLQISTDGGSTWNNVGSAINRYDGTIGWKKHTIDISSYTGTGMNDVRIGFLGVSSYGNDCHIDDVSVTNGVNSEPNGINVNGASHVTITENTINGFTNIGIYVHDYALSNNILNNVVNNNAYDGVTVTPFDPATGHIPDGTPVTFTTDLGSIGCKTIDKETTGGIATATLTADELAGIAHITGTTDAQTVNTEVTINPKSSLYLTVTPDKTNPVVGDTVIYTLKVGNKGPDTATNVVMTYVVPEGLEFAGANVDNGTYTYDAATRTITWTIGDVPVGDPYMWLSLKILRSGSFLINPQLSTRTYDPTLNTETQSITIHAAAASNNSTNSTVHAANTVSMQHTGVPVVALILALFMVIGGIVSSKK